VLTFVFYPDLFLAKTAPLVGDHWEQHFPWSSLLHDNLRNWGKLPFWTPSIHCGFPIAAESQIGIFYFPNLILARILPLHWAYSYSVVLHLLLSAIATFFYARELGLKHLPAFLCACIFTFGTAYGGAYYNITSLKTLSWFPLQLVLLERYVKTSSKWLLAGLSFTGALSLVAGYLQVSILSHFVLVIYSLVRVFIFPPQSLISIRSKLFVIVFLLLTALGALALASPQILLTFQLAVQSNRSSPQEDYAYVGSLSPFAFLTVLFPHTQGLFRGNCLYNGIFPIFLYLVACFSPTARATKAFRIWSTMTIISILFALGRWSPLYVLFIKATHFYSFRTPAKFLVFINFGLAMLAGIGLQELLNLNAGREIILKKISRLFLIFVFFFLGIAGFSYSMLRWGRNLITTLGEWAVVHFIYAKPGHPHSLATYLQKLQDIFDFATKLFLPNNFWSLWILFILIIHWFLLFWLRKRSGTRPLSLLIFLFVLDVYAFTWADMRADFLSYKQIKQIPRAIDVLLKEKESGLLNRTYSFHKAEESSPLAPSTNMLYGINTIGAYSPLVMSRYYETIGQFGDVNDSNVSVSPTADFILARLEVIKALGVSHIISTDLLVHEELQQIYSESANKIIIYRIQESTDTVFFVSKWKALKDWESLKVEFMTPHFDPRLILLLEESEALKLPLTAHINNNYEPVFIKQQTGQPQENIWNIETKQPGFFIFMQTDYPGWHVYVNGGVRPLLKAYGLFQGVYIEAPGKYHIQFKFRASKSLKMIGQSLV